MPIYLLLMAVALLSFSVKSYRFVCNGMLANGESRSDECGKCDDETAARWENSNVAVVTCAGVRSFRSP